MSAKLHRVEPDGPPCISAHNCGIEVLEMLLKSGADLNARTKWGDNALHYAARRGGAEVMRFLIDRGIEIGKPEVGGATIIHCGASSQM